MGDNIEIGITFIFRFRCRPIQLVVFVPVGLSSFLRHLLHVLLGVEVSSVARPGQFTVRIQVQRSTVQAMRQKKFKSPTIKIISDLNFNGQLPKPDDRRNFDTQQDLQKM